jgi:hypothetical protein
MTRTLLAALSHDGHARSFLAQPRREIALRAALIVFESVAYRIDRGLEYVRGHR